MAIEAVSDIQRASSSAFSAGAVSINRAVVTVSPAAFDRAFVTVAVPGMLPGAKIMCQLEPSSEWEADDLTDAEVLATAGADSVEFCIAMPGPIVGEFDVLYLVG